MSKTRASKKKSAEIDKEISSLIKNMKKKKLESGIEDSVIEGELESDLEQAEMLRDLEFHEFMRPLDTEEKTDTVLERMALAAPRPIFVGNIPQGAIRDEDEKEVKYVSSSSESKEPKYFESSAVTYTQPERVDINEAGRQGSFDSRRDAKFLAPEFKPEPRIEEPPWQAERVNFENLGREKEKRDYKFKIPK